MTIDELIPSIIPLFHTEKIRLVQLVLQQIAQEEGAAGQPPPQAAERFDPKRFYGVARPAMNRRNPLKDSVTFEKDIVSPIGDEWDAAQ